MNSSDTIKILCELAAVLKQDTEGLEEKANQAYQHNKWFTRSNVFFALNGIINEFLDEKKLKAWLLEYDAKEPAYPAMVGMVMAGNIPLVGFHDFLCVLVSGNNVLIKLSSKDQVLFPYLLKKLFEIDPLLQNRIFVTEILKGMNAVIATGSDNSSRYFQYYFGKYPHIIRKNRNAVAVLTGEETKTDLEKLAEDIFTYFGLGCRNVSKLLVPRNYDFNFFFESMEQFADIRHHNKYKNNFDYYRTLLAMKHEPHLINDFLILKEDAGVSSPVSLLHYEFYDDARHLQQLLLKDAGHIQCIVGSGYIPFGAAQTPQLGDYADHIDTLEFLLRLSGK